MGSVRKTRGAPVSRMTCQRRGEVKIKEGGNDKEKEGGCERKIIAPKMMNTDTTAQACKPSLRHYF